MTGTHDIYTQSDTFNIVVDHYGDARGTKSQFANSDPSLVNPLINENIAAYHFATETLAPQLTAIRNALNACWKGGSAEHALSILTLLDGDAKTIGTNTKACHDSFVTFQTSWIQLKGEASGLYEGVAGTGVHEDNAGAHRIFKEFNDAMQTSMRAMPAHLRYSDPLDEKQTPGSPGGAGPGGPGPGGPGPGGWGPGPGSYGPGGPGPGGWGPGNGPGTGSPGGVHGPGAIGSPGGAGTYSGGNSGYSPGSGLDAGSQLSSYTGAGMGPGGPGFGAPGPGAPVATGLSGSTAGLGAVGAGVGVGGLGADEAGASGGRGPLGGRGAGGGTGDDEDERDRTTWLSEEEGIWDGESGAPPGTIA